MKLLEYLIRVKNGINYITTSNYGKTVESGTATINTGTPLVLTTTKFNAITILADPSNTNDVLIGSFPLKAGASQSLSFSDVASISLTTTGVGQIIYWIGVK